MSLSHLLYRLGVGFGVRGRSCLLVVLAKSAVNKHTALVHFRIETSRDSCNNTDDGFVKCLT